MEDKQPHLENRANLLIVAVTASTPSDAESAFETASVALYEVRYFETRGI